MPMRNEAYWAKYYGDQIILPPPSNFAVWAKPRIRGNFVWDIGCGSGRDTHYLGAIGVDPYGPHIREAVELGGAPCLPTDTVYARWFLHAVDRSVEDWLLDWTQGQLLVEARVFGDELDDDSHWRRPIDPDDFLIKLLNFEYDIKYFEVARGFSKVGDDDPLLLRVDAQRAT